MDKLRLFFVVFLALLFTGSVSAQDFAFKVLGAKGDIQADGQAIKVGSKITSTQTLKIADGAYLGLTHKGGKTLELTTAGTYKVSDLEKKVNTGGSDLANKYAQFVMNEMMGNGNQNSNSRVKTGSVTRGDMDPIQLMMPKRSSFTTPKVTLKWYLKDESHPVESYKVLVRNNFKEVIYEQEVNSNFLTMDFSDEKLSQSKFLTVEVQSAKEGEEHIHSSEHALIKLKGSALDTFKNEISELPNDDTAISKIILARFYEEKGLIGNAMNAYDEALNISDLDQYKNLYNSFLTRNALVKSEENNN